MKVEPTPTKIPLESYQEEEFVELKAIMFTFSQTSTSLTTGEFGKSWIIKTNEID